MNLRENANGSRASPLREVFSSFTLELQEREGKKLTIVKGTAAKANIINRNRRYYSREVYQAAVDACQEDIKAGKMIGLLDHPEWHEPLKGRAEKIAVKWTSITLEADEVKVEGVIVKTTAGREVEALAEADVAMGLSTNGVGSQTFVKAKEIMPDYPDPEEYIGKVQDDYRFATIDVVNDPSNIYGQMTQESEQYMTLEELKAKFPKLYEQIVAEGKAQGTPPVMPDNTKELSALEARLVALETENKSLKTQNQENARKAIVTSALSEAKLPELGKSGEIDLDARFKRTLETAAIGAKTDEEAKEEVQALIAERKALLGNAKVMEKDEKGSNTPGISSKKKTEAKEASSNAREITNVLARHGIYK